MDNQVQPASPERLQEFANHFSSSQPGGRFTLGVYDSLASTMDLAPLLIAETARPETTEVCSASLQALRSQLGVGRAAVAVARHQSRGRGQKGREWISLDAHGLYCTTSFEYLLSDGRIAALPLVVGLVIATVLEQEGVQLKLKWPNDIVVQAEGRIRKLAGVLCESTVQASQGLVSIGFGINLRSHAALEQVQGIALDRLVSREISEAALLQAIIEELFACVHEFLRVGLSPFITDWQERCVHLGEVVQIVEGEEERSMRVVGLDPSGGLVVESEPGKRRVLHSAELTVYDVTSD